MTIRKAKRNDLDNLAALEEKCFPGDAYPRSFLTQAHELFEETLLVSEESDGKITGYIMAGPKAASPDKWWILVIATLPEMRGKGIGSQLIRSALDAIHASGGKTVSLSVAEKNRGAISLYHKFDFSVVEPIQNYFGPKQDRLIMRHCFA